MTKEKIYRLKYFWPKEIAKISSKESFWNMTKDRYLQLDEKQQTEFLTKLFNVEGKEKK